MPVFGSLRDAPMIQRAASCSDVRTNDPTEKTQLRRCATFRADSTRGWGIVPVLNELEQRVTTDGFHARHTSMLRRTSSAAQLVCDNCHGHFVDQRVIEDPSATPRQFCSLDCKNSHAYKYAVQQKLADDWSEGSSDVDLITVPDDVELPLS